MIPLQWDYCFVHSQNLLHNTSNIGMYCAITDIRKIKTTMH